MNACSTCYYYVKSKWGMYYCLKSGHELNENQVELAMQGQTCPEYIEDIHKPKKI